MERPAVSVLMPTYRHEQFISRAIRSLTDQAWSEWELVIVDDGSTDATSDAVEPFLRDARVRYVRNEVNGGLGAALNQATALARGELLAYLPSDDVFDRHHLSSLVESLRHDPGAFLAYAGVRWGQDMPGRGRLSGATLQGDEAVGRERDVLASPLRDRPYSGNLLALVQVAHRRHLEHVRWPTRAEEVSDRLEADHWVRLLELGARFVYTGSVSCEWTEHPDQRHKIIAGFRHLSDTPLGESGGTGLSAYRRRFGIAKGTWLNWQPSYGFRLDEGARYARYAVERQLPSDGGLRILVVGALGYNPERLMAFEERGHKLIGLWSRDVEWWDTVGPLPFGNMDDIQFEPGWEDQVRRARPDVVYALLNWNALDAVGQVLDAALGIPIVFHYKESPWYAQQYGLARTLRRALLESDAQVFISAENRDWYRWWTGGDFPNDTTLILDGDLPKAVVAVAEDWAPKLSDDDGAVHTLSAGRAYGLEDLPFAPIAAADIHVHIYGIQNVGPRRLHRPWVRDGLASGYLHLHQAVQPQDWVREFSRYDAAWGHVFTSSNHGELSRASWDDLNLPARLPTVTAAGLPWIMPDHHDSVVAANALGRRHGLGIFYDSLGELREMLADRPFVRERAANAVAARHELTFDGHVDALIDLLRRVAR